MFRKTMFLVLGVVLSLIVTVPVLAAASSTGVVVEGESVLGVALGDSRAQVEAAWGQPASCTNLSYYDGRQGLNGICQFDVDGGGRVTVHYFGADGGPAQDSADDYAFNFRWPQAVSGWVTTAGVNTTLALADPDAVIAAYPNAVVTYNRVFGNIESIQDEALGILVDYSFDYLSGRLFVDMAIFFPREPAPVPQKETHVTGIDLTVTKVKGDRQVRALVRVQDEQQWSASGANVLATWVFSDGSTQAVSDLTSSTGYAYFEILDAPRGTLAIRIDDVLLDGYQFDRANSILSASTSVK